MLFSDLQVEPLTLSLVEVFATVPVVVRRWVHLAIVNLIIDVSDHRKVHRMRVE